MPKNDINIKNIFSLTSLPSSQALSLMLASITVNILGLATPLILMQIYDRIIAHENKSTLVALIVGGTVAIFIEAFLKFYKGKLLNRLSSEEEFSLSIILLKKVLFSNPKSQKDIKASKLTEGIESLNQIRQVKINDALNALFDLPFLFFYVLALYFLNVQIAVFNAIVIIITITMMFFFTRRESKQKKTWLQLKNEELEFQSEILLKSNIIKSISLEKILYNQFWDLKGKLQTYHHKEKIYSSIITATTQSLSLICLLGTVLLGAFNATEGRITIGGLTACTLIAGKIMQPVFSLIRYWIRIPEVRIRTDELLDIYNIPQITQTEKNHLKDVEKVLSIKNLTIKDGENLIFNDMRFKFDPHQIYMLKNFSANEVEKFFETLIFEFEEHRNTIFINGTALEKIANSDLRKTIFYIPKEGDFFNGTILENISLFSENNQLAELCASLLSLDSYYNELKDGYETTLNTEALENLPISLLQRIQLARALYFRPKILLIDKIDQDMDQETKEIFKNTLHRLKTEMTIIFASDLNYENTFYDFDLRLQDGKLRINI